MTLLLSVLTAGAAAALNLPDPGVIVMSMGYIGLLVPTTIFRNSSIGLLCVFTLTGFTGCTLGPIINAYLSMRNGWQLVMIAKG